MTDYYIDPEDIITDFLRTRLIDPRDRAENIESQTFNPSTGDTEIILSNPTVGTISCVTNVTIDLIKSNKWKNYYWDYQNNKLIFFNSFSGTEEVIISYKYGSTNWIYSDRPDDNLSQLNFPRISLFSVSGGGVRLGQYTAPVESSPIIQIDLWVKENQIFTIDNRKYSNEYLSRYLANQISRVFEKFEGDLIPILYNYIPISIGRQAPYAEEYQAFHTIMEINFKALRLGRIEV